MIDQSILRAQQNRESSTEKQRQSCFVQMMNKIYEAKITKKDKPFIHGMYQNYHQKFCNKFKTIYVEQAREAFVKGKNQSKLVKAFESKESMIESKSQSQISSKNSSILKAFQEDKKNSSSEIRDNEIKKIDFSCELKTQIIPNEMKKKNAPQQPEFASKIKLQQIKKQVDPPQIIVAYMIHQPSKDKLRSQIKSEIYQSQQRLQPIQQSKPIQKIKLQRQVIKKEEEKLQKKEQPKLSNQNSKKEQIKNKKQSQEQCQEVEQQDNSPSFYDLKRKLQQIDEPNKHVTRSQIVTSSNNSQLLKTQELKINSHIIQKDSNQRKQQEFQKQIQNEEKLIQEKKKSSIQEDKVQLQKKVDIIEVESEPHRDLYQKLLKSQLQNQLILQEQKEQEKKNEEKQQIRSPKEKYSKIESEEKKEKFNEQHSILTESLAQKSQVEIGSPQQIEQDQLSMSLQSSLIDNTLEQNTKQATNIFKNNLIINENKESQSNNSEKKTSLASVQIQMMPFIEFEAKAEPKRIEVPIEKQTVVSSLFNNSQNGLFDDYESRVEKLIAGLVQQIDKKIKPCEKCAPPTKQQSQSQKNSSDDDS